jgi:tol-pal system protein YbgF
MRLLRLGVLICSFSLNTVAYAIAPVIDAYDDDGSSSANTTESTNTADKGSSTVRAPANDASSFSLDQRVTILERQVANLNPLLVQIDDLNQRIQGLQGRLEEQQHQLKLLTEQIQLHYQEFAKRLTQTKPPTAATSAVSAVASTDNSSNTATNNSVAPANRAPATSIPTAAGERAYQTAFQLLKSKQYVAAITEFENFVKKYPTDINLANANYFLGQLYLLQGQPEQSISRFGYFINTYPQDARVPDALLQLGLAYFAKGDKTTAIDTFKRIIQQYPDSKAAQAAQARLQQFQAMISAANMETKDKG